MVGSDYWFLLVLFNDDESDDNFDKVIMKFEIGLWKKFGYLWCRTLLI